MRIEAQRDAVGELVAVHSLTWLVVGNGVGLLLATLLLLPRLGSLLGPYSYGRWMPLHLDLQLYGWCSLPMVGLLLELYLPRSGPWRLPWRRLPRLAVGLWSGSLLFGAVSWLSGDASGKLFLDWSGPARIVLAANLGCLALVLVIAFAGQIAERRQQAGQRWILIAKGALLAGLLAVPAVLYLAASPEVYPPINPDSGGATGGSLMGSTLGLVAIFYLSPFFAGLTPRDGGRAAARTGLALVLHGVWFALLDHGDRSHHEIVQVLSLASLGVWLPLLADHLRRFPWPPVSRRWLFALGGWGALLLATGVVTFLPGVLERLKFTNALVAHAHVAMAGMVTCFNVLVLLHLLRRSSAAGDVFADRTSFALWHGGALGLAGSLLVLGLLEGASPGLLFRPGSAAGALYAVRWLGGLAMLIASLRWLGAALAASLRLSRERRGSEVAARCAG